MNKHLEAFKTVLNNRPYRWCREHYKEKSTLIHQITLAEIFQHLADEYPELEGTSDPEELLTEMGYYQCGEDVLFVHS